MAFGSGEHGSTRGALVLLDRFVQPGDRVLDLGTGSGILAIAAVKLGARHAVGIEIDAEAHAGGRGQRRAERSRRRGDAARTATRPSWRRSAGRPT